MATCERVQTNEYLLRLSEEEALAVNVVVGQIVGSNQTTARKYTSAVFHAMEKLLRSVDIARNSPFYLPDTPSLCFPNPLPTPEPPPLTLADIKPGEWFTTPTRTSPRYRVFNGYVSYGTGPPYFYDEQSFRGDTWQRLTPAEARELAREHGYLFPF